MEAPPQEAPPQKRRKITGKYGSPNNGAVDGESMGLLKKQNRNQHRASSACETCRHKKVRCDESSPTCTFCKRHGFRCEYQGSKKESDEKLISQLVERLSQVEEKLAILSTSNERRKQETTSFERSEKNWSSSVNEVATPPSAIATYLNTVLLSPAATVDKRSPAETANQPIAHEGNYDRPFDTTNDNQSPITYQSGIFAKLEYAQRGTPLSCEESRPPLPDFLSKSIPTAASNILPLLENFFERVCPLFPIICDVVTFKMASEVTMRGFRDDMWSCLILVMIGLSKAYKAPLSPESGLSDFQRALDILSRLSVEYSLEHSQAQILAALFLLKKGRLLNFWSYLHSGCSSLYTMIRRDEETGYERSPDDIKTTLRLYWISYNLERDLRHVVYSFPSSLLYQLENNLTLPLGYDEPNSVHLKAFARTTYTYFLAEMSLKAIISRILEAPGLNHLSNHNFAGSVEVSPIVQELKLQLEEWELTVPTFLDWSPQARKGTSVPVGIRLKLLYWFARFSLARPLILHVLDDSSYRLPFHGWTFFQDGLLAGLNMVKIAIPDERDINIIMGNRLISTISVLNLAVSKGSFGFLGTDDVCETLHGCINMLRARLACNSEWVACRLREL
ncbi:hypothetical protein BDZ45DRAFT_627092 [Acephala macrosclerotiorum]|nr:hypothetical protein BDZ45DRAFT_627092 [Acephala macrosclerotiorum]